MLLFGGEWNFTYKFNLESFKKKILFVIEEKENKVNYLITFSCK